MGLRRTSGHRGRHRACRSRRSKAEPFRTIEHDGGEHALHIDPEGDHRYRLPDGLEITERARDRFTIRQGDPLSARVECDRVLGLERGDWKVEVRTRSVMTADRDSFRLLDTVEAFEAGDLVFERTWDRSIPRTLVYQHHDLTCR